MATIHVAKCARSIIVVREEKSRERAIGRVVTEEEIDGLQETLRLIQRKRKLAAEIGLQIRHQESRGNSLSSNISDNETEALGAETRSHRIATPWRQGCAPAYRAIQRQRLRKEPA